MDWRMGMILMGLVDLIVSLIRLGLKDLLGLIDLLYLEGLPGRMQLGRG
jgi:hypothetical protein